MKPNLTPFPGLFLVSEFRLAGDQGEQGKIDLLTVLAHELGHVHGFEHEDDGVMAESLGTGFRRLSGSDPVPWLAAVWFAGLVEDFTSVDLSRFLSAAGCQGYLR